MASPCIDCMKHAIYLICVRSVLLPNGAGGGSREPYKVWQFTHESSLHHRLSALLTNIINCMSCKFILHVSISTIHQPDYRFRHHASYVHSTRCNESNSRREIMLKPYNIFRTCWLRMNVSRLACGGGLDDDVVRENWRKTFYNFGFVLALVNIVFIWFLWRDFVRFELWD